MKFVWEDTPTIGHYKCTLYSDEGNEMTDISFWDYTCEYSIQSDRKRRRRRPYAFETRFCHGWSHDHGFDYDKDYKHHDGGYQGVCTHTVADVKRWCEEFLAHLYIIDYDAELKKLDREKQISDWFLTHGYTGQYEKENENA